MNIAEIPFAEWLEGFVKSIADFNPVWIGVSAINKDGQIMTAYTDNDNAYVCDAIRTMIGDAAFNWVRGNKEILKGIIDDENS